MKRDGTFVSQRTNIMLDGLHIQATPIARAATLIGLSGVIYKSAERFLNSTQFYRWKSSVGSKMTDWKVGRTRLKQQHHHHQHPHYQHDKRYHNVPGAATRSPGGLRNPPVLDGEYAGADDYSGDERRSAGGPSYSPAVVEGEVIPGAARNMLFRVSDNATTITTIMDLLGGGRSAVFVVNSATSPEDSVHIRKIMEASAKLKAYGIDRVVCVVKSDSLEAQAMRDREGILEHRVIILADPHNRFETACGLDLADRRGAIYLDYGAVVGSVHIGGNKHSADDLLGFLHTMHLNSAPNSPYPELASSKSQQQQSSDNFV